jgi:photosystem II stability/assembly factor-like uncharacterized protein
VTAIVKPLPQSLAIVLLSLVVFSACRPAPAGVPAVSATAAPILATRVPITLPSATISADEPTPTPLPPSPTPSPTPQPASPTPTMLPWSLNVSSMGRLSLTEGWVITGERLLWTEDAGTSWSDITPAGLSNCPPPDVCSIASPPVFFDSTHARMAVLRFQERDPRMTLSLMYTLNGGRSWSLSVVDELDADPLCPGPGCLRDVDLELPDERNGWLWAHAPLGMENEQFYLYRTRDGGQSWTELAKYDDSGTGGPGYVPRMPILHQIAFIDAWSGWATGGWRWDTDSFVVSRDGGRSWQSVLLDTPERYANMELAYHDPVFFSRVSGMLPVRLNGPEGRGQVLAFYATEDGGGSWELISTLEDSELETYCCDDRIPWSAIDESTWFVAVSEAKQYLTRDRGQSWEVIAGAGLNGLELAEVQFVAEAEGWGLARICYRDFGCMRLLYATHDGGRTWTHIIPGS